MNFRVLRGANVKSIFKSHKLFRIFFLKISSLSILIPVSISMNVFRCCGCKSTTFIYIYKPFLYIISIFFKTFSSYTQESGRFAAKPLRLEGCFTHFLDAEFSAPSSGNWRPSPDRSGNPFYGGVRHKKIAADSGKQLLKKNPNLLNSKSQNWMRFNPLSMTKSYS